MKFHEHFFGELKELNIDFKKPLKGRLHYFYHSPSSKLPIRDADGENSKKNEEDHVTEPHLEVEAEGFIAPCKYQNIKPFIENDDEGYLFFITTCRNKDLKEYYHNQYIVGYMKKEKILPRKGPYKRYSEWNCVIGEMKFYRFEDAILVNDTPSRKGFLHKKVSPTGNGGKCLSFKEEGDIVLSQTQTKKILNHFKNKRTINEEWIKEIEKKDKDGKETCLLREGEDCIFKEKCPRWKTIKRFLKNY